MWTFYCYDDGKPTDLWASWYQGVDYTVRAAHDQLMDILEKQARWESPHIRAVGNSLFEIRLQGKVKWRLGGFFGPKGVHRAFTIVLIWNHKQHRYDPPNALKTARKRIALIEKGTGKAKISVRPK